MFNLNLKVRPGAEGKHFLHQDSAGYVGERATREGGYRLYTNGQN